jgi:alkyl hydroperoxide reductase subunit AhpC
MPRLNEPAPAFEAPTTHGVKKLEDYRGKWLVLFSHPADFTPVCTTEFIAFAKRHADFQAINCELLGLSIDSHYSHIAWERNIKEKFGVDIGFPIIADLSMQVAKAYGMIQPGAKRHIGRSRHLHHRPGGHSSGHGVLSDEQRPLDRRVCPSGKGHADLRRAQGRYARELATGR